MIETNNNVLSATATDCVKWASGDDGPDSQILFPYMEGGSTMDAVPSQPIAKHGMKYITFQFTFIPEDGEPPSGYEVQFHLQSSQDGIHWDDIPDDSFTPNLNTLVVSPTVTSFTVEVECLSNYIRVLSTASVEATEPNQGDSVRIYQTQLES
jgi:hypothetical protein